MTEIIVVCHEDVKKIGINLAYKLFRLIILPSPYNTTSLSFTALTRTSVSSAVNRSWRAPGKYAIIIAIHNGTCAPAFKGNVG